MIQEATQIITEGKDLTSSQMQTVMEEIMTGRSTTPQIVAFLTNLNRKGETIDELTAAVKVMRRYAIKVKTKQKVILDTCGTGGDTKHTFNISTAVAFVACGLDIAVAKHGNRCVSSKSGSADILEALGININMTKEQIEKCLDEVGIAFIFAPNFHPAMKYAMPARKEIGAPTIFNLLGPLSNPAGATHQLLGVFDSHRIDILAHTLANLGIIHALVVHGNDGLDEISTMARTLIREVREGEVKINEINPEDFGFKKPELNDLSGGTAQDNAKILLNILKGKIGPHRDIVLLNAGAAIYTADKAGSIKEGIAQAKESIDSKKALKKLELLKEFSNR
jgi:anthranilate phosphoribosyltransferase